jgi:putative ABC transport system substrate-binding protein
MGFDPVQPGLVASLNRPGGNVTGMTSLAGELVGKQLGVLHDLLPQATQFGVLINRNNPFAASIVDEARVAAHAIGATTEVVIAGTAARSTQPSRTSSMKSASKGS